MDDETDMGKKPLEWDTIDIKCVLGQALVAEAAPTSAYENAIRNALNGPRDQFSRLFWIGARHAAECDANRWWPALKIIE
jgi:hypothetical protein